MHHQRNQTRAEAQTSIVRTSLGRSILGLGLGLGLGLTAACDPSSELDSDLDDQIIESDWLDRDAPIGSADESSEPSPIVAEVEVGTDGKIVFYDESAVVDGVEDVVVGIGFTGGDTIGALAAYDEHDATPLELFLAVAPEAPVPEVLQKDHALLAAAGRAEAEPRDFSGLPLFRATQVGYCYTSSQWLSDLGGYSWDDWSASYMPSGQKVWGPYYETALYFYSGYSDARALGGCNHFVGQTGTTGYFQIHWRADDNDSWHSTAYWNLGQNAGYYYRSSGLGTRQYRGWVYHPSGDPGWWYVNAAW